MFNYRASNMSEPKAQRWRAIIVYRDGKSALLVVGQSQPAVKETYEKPWFDLYDDFQHSQTREILLQKWVGAADQGHWETQLRLPIPAAKIAISA